jgi:hypothetical protein
VVVQRLPQHRRSSLTNTCRCVVDGRCYTRGLAASCSIATIVTAGCTKTRNVGTRAPTDPKLLLARRHCCVRSTTAATQSAVWARVVIAQRLLPDRRSSLTYTPIAELSMAAAALVDSSSTAAPPLSPPLVEQRQLLSMLDLQQIRSCRLLAVGEEPLLRRQYTAGAPQLAVCGRAL